MSLRKLPEIKAFDGLSALTFEPDESALARWNPGVKAATEGDDNIISIYDVIGEEFFGEGVTSKRIAAALRRIGQNEVTVNVNSPGGDFFQGIAIYNLLREHPEKVTVKIMGLAASAASVIAMAGDEIQASEASFIMIHNAWAVAIGNRHDFREAANVLEPFDDSMATLYAKRAGVDKAQAATWMDEEKWFNGSQAVDEGLADSLMSSDEVSEGGSGTKSLAAVRRVEAALAKQGLPRSERRKLLSEMKGFTPSAEALEGGMPGAVTNVMPCAGDEVVADINRLIETIKS